MVDFKIFLISALTGLPAVAVFVELLTLLPLGKNINRLKFYALRSLKVVSSKKISDHHKEKALLAYSLIIFKSNILSTLYLFTAIAGFATVFSFISIFCNCLPGNISEQLMSLETMLSAMFTGTIYALIRKKIRASRKSDDQLNPKHKYSGISKIIHHTAMNRAVRETSLDIDKLATSTKDKVSKSGPPVYITGLARAGTTLILEAIYSTKVFSSLTYRDMPFVLAPFLWSKVSMNSRKNRIKSERAHGDRLLVNYDSPEALEEVFWKTVTDEKYINNNSLEPHEIKGKNLETYKKYINNILLREKNRTAERYLAKNNNNTLRIKSIKKIFPESVIIVPFRNPLQHAASLLKQHKNFIKMQIEDKFVLKYMQWLVHHEFGRDFRPFSVSPNVFPKNEKETENIKYWLKYWTEVYSFILEKHADHVCFINYDKLCDQPEVELKKIASLISVEKSALLPFASGIKSAGTHDISEKKIQKHKCCEIYDTLIEKSL